MTTDPTTAAIQSTVEIVQQSQKKRKDSTTISALIGGLDVVTSLDLISDRFTLGE